VFAACSFTRRGRGWAARRRQARRTAFGHRKRRSASRWSTCEHVAQRMLTSACAAHVRLGATSRNMTPRLACCSTRLMPSFVGKSSAIGNLLILTRLRGANLREPLHVSIPASGAAQAGDAASPTASPDLFAFSCISSWSASRAGPPPALFGVFSWC